MKIATLGAGGMIGGALTRRLVDDGHEVVAVDVKPVRDWIMCVEGVDNRVLDLRYLTECREAVAGCDRVYLHAADMGGMGHIETHRADCAFNSLITMHVLLACRDESVGRVFFAGSACCYPAQLQGVDTLRLYGDGIGLAEHMAVPADPEPGYGWSKLFDEFLCEYVREDWGVETRIGRYHNVAAVPTTWTGGREKAPAALCRKAAEAKLTGSKTIDIWGDGSAVRSFCWIEDAVEGTIRLMESDYPHPVNIGSDESVTINELADMAEQAAMGYVGAFGRTYDLSAPQGVMGRKDRKSVV